MENYIKDNKLLLLNEQIKPGSPPMKFKHLIILLLATGYSCQKDSVPNFLFAIADDASYPHMGAYGCDWVRTPAFDKVAKEGVLFANAYTPNAKCAPSRACILTGRNSWQLEEGANHWPYFPAKFKTFAEVLHENGYFVGYTYKGYSPGIALKEDGSKRDLLVRAFNERSLNPPTSGIAKNDYAGNFAAFLEERPAGTPFFFWYGSVEPHRAYEFQSGSRLSGKSLADINNIPRFWPDTDTVRNDLLDYAFEIEYFDSHLQKMLNLLEKYGETENTVVFVTADNGMPFPRVKGQAYDYSNHLPLAIRWPKGIKYTGRTVVDFVSFIDFAPTILKLAHIETHKSGMFPITGIPLSDIFKSSKSQGINSYRDFVLIGKERHDVGRPEDQGYPIRGIIKDGFLYIRNFEADRWPAGDPVTGYLNCDASPTKSLILKWNRQKLQEHYWIWSFGKRPREELYKLEEDRECMNNLATDPGMELIKSLLAQVLEEKLLEQEDPRLVGKGYLFDNYPYADQRNANFYNRFMSGEKLRASWVEPSDFEIQ